MKIMITVLQVERTWDLVRDSGQRKLTYSSQNHCTFYTSFRSAQNHCPLDNVCPRGAFISVGDCTPTEKDLLLLTTCRSGSLLDWDKNLPFYAIDSRNFFWYGSWKIWSSREISMPYCPAIWLTGEILFLLCNLSVFHPVNSPAQPQNPRAMRCHDTGFFRCFF